MIAITPPKPKITQTSVFYINDLHGQVPRMEELKSASLAFDTFARQNNADAIKTCSGDTLVGGDKKTFAAGVEFLNYLGVKATTLGNHELDGGTVLLNEALEKAKFKVLGMNMNFTKDLPLAKKIVRSYVQEINGNKYGLIGIQPPELLFRMKLNVPLDGFSIDNEKQTIKELQEEVNTLNKQGVNKIILLSHAGLPLEKKIAQSVSGIDVILGGHTHDKIEGVELNKNLFFSPANESVVITQAFRDGNNFGVLNLKFDENGKILSVQNTLGDTRTYNKNIAATMLIDKHLGKTENIGVLKYADSLPSNLLVAENPYADFFTDAARIEFNTDIAITNSGNQRGMLKSGTVTGRDISSLSPFKNNMCKKYISQKEVVEAIKEGLKSLTADGNKPGILQVSGLRYTANRKGELKELYFVDKTGKQIPIDVNNPDPNVNYTVAITDYYGSGVEGFTSLGSPDKFIERHDFDNDKLAIDYIKKMNGKPFEIKLDGRIKIVDN